MTRISEKKRIIAIVMAVVYIFVIFSAALYISSEAGHKCIGDHCPVCEYISYCENILSSVSTVLIIAVVIALMVLLRIICPKFSTTTLQFSNPIYLKVKLLN